MAKEVQSPGAFLALMLEKYKLNPFRLSKEIKLSQSAVRLITIGKTKITTPVAMRLAKYFNTNPEFWLTMQIRWDIAEAAQDKALAKVIKGISRVTKAPAGGRKQAAVAKKPRLKKKARPKNKAAAKKRAVARKPVRARRKTAARRGRPAKK